MVLNTFLLSEIFYHIYFVCVCLHTRVWRWEKILRSWFSLSALLIRRLKESNSNPQAWQRVPLPHWTISLTIDKLFYSPWGAFLWVSKHRVCCRDRLRSPQSVMMEILWRNSDLFNTRMAEAAYGPPITLPKTEGAPWKWNFPPMRSDNPIAGLELLSRSLIAVGPCCVLGISRYGWGRGWWWWSSPLQLAGTRTFWNTQQ